MKAELFFNEDTGTGSCTITKEKTDPVYRDSEWGTAESRILYHLKKELNKQGYDFIKKLMHKDGHMVSDNQHYLRERKIKKGVRCLAIHNEGWLISGIEETFNTTGKAVLSVEDIGV